MNLPYPTYFNYLVTLITCLLFAIAPNAQVSQWQHYTTRQGLVDNKINTLFQDQKGFVWIGCYEGVSRFDGYQFTNYTQQNGLANDFAAAFMPIGKDSLLVIHSTGEITLLANGEISRNIKRVENSSIVFKTQNDNYAIYSPTGSIYTWEKDSLAKRELNNQKRKIDHLTPDGRGFWLGSSPDSIAWFDKTLQPLSPHVKGFSNGFHYQKGEIWAIGEQGAKKVMLNHKHKSLDFLPIPQPYAALNSLKKGITCLHIDFEETLWIGTQTGLYSLPTGGNHVKEELPGIVVTCLLEDNKKGIWAGTAVGVSRKQLGIQKTYYGAPKGIQPSVYGSIGINRESLQLITEHFYTNLNLTTKKLQPVQQQPSSKIMQYRTGTNEWLILEQNAPAKKYKRTGETISWTWPAKRHFYYDLKKISDHWYMGGLENGFEIIGPDMAYRDSIQIPQGVFRLIYHPLGYVFAGTWGHGLYQIKLQDNFKDSAGFTVNKVPDDLLPDTAIRSLMVDANGALWVGTRRGGLAQYRITSHGLVLQNKWNSQNGLHSNWVSALEQDSTGNIWIGTALGLYKKNRGRESDAFIPVGKFIDHEIMVQHILTGDSNRLYIQDFTGLMILDSRLPIHYQNISCHITRVKADFLPRKDNAALPSLPYHDANLEIHFSTPEFYLPHLLQFQYRVLGIGDTSWNDVGNQRMVSLVGLRSGRYQFEVRVTAPDGALSPTEIFAFAVIPPFWQRIWFWLLCASVLAAAMFAYFQYRLRQIKKLFNLRQQIAADLHDEIGSSLANIGILGALSEKAIDMEDNKLRGYIERIGEESQLSKEALDDIIWSVDTRHDNLKDLMHRIRRYAGEMLEENHIECRFAMDLPEAHVTLSMEQRRDIYLLLKEAIHNIVKHAKATKVAITCKVAHGSLQFNIEDNGIGLAQKNEQGHGLHSMEQRVKRWKGSFKLINTPAKGLLVSIAMPVQA